MVAEAAATAEGVGVAEVTMVAGAGGDTGITEAIVVGTVIMAAGIGRRLAGPRIRKPSRGG